MVTLKIPYPPKKSQWCKAFGMNAIYSGKHWAVRKKDAELWHALTIGAMNKARCPREPFKNPVSITFLWNDRMDLSNHAYMAKMIEDALKGRLIVDDSRNWVQEIHHSFWTEESIGIIVEEIS